MTRQSSQNIEKVSSRQSPVARKKLETGNWKLTTLCFSALILFLAFFLRFHNLGAQSFWNDEGSSYVQATRSFADIAANAARDIHPPGYYWLLSIWRQFVGDSEFALRSLSAFASVLTVAFTYALGKRLFNPAAGLAASLFVALNTFSIYYAQEARMYALLALWSVMGMWALTQVLGARYNVLMDRPDRKRRICRDTIYRVRLKIRRIHFSLSISKKHVARSTLYLALVNAAGLYTQYAYPFVMLAQGAIFLVWLFSRLKTGNWRLVTGNYIVANGLAILLYLPWLPTALQQVTQWPSTGAPIPAGEALNTIFSWFAFGMIYLSNSVDLNLLDAVLLWLNFVSILLIVFGLLRWFSSTNVPALTPPLRIRGGGQGGGVNIPLLWVLVPVGLFLILGLFRPANLKFLLPSQIGFVLILGLGAGGWWITPRSGWLRRFHKGLAILSVVPIVAFSITLLLSLYTDSDYQRPDYRSMVATITIDPRPGDAIILDAPNQEEVFRYYYRGDAPVYPLPPGLGGNDAETAALTQDIIRRHDRIFVLFWGEAERDPNHIVENTLDSQTFQAGIDQWYGDVRFVEYVTPADMPDLTPSGAHFGDSITLTGYALSATTLQPGEVLQARLDWQTNTPLTTPYKVFVQLLNSAGTLVAQRDSEPNSGSSPTTVWIPGETVTDRHGLNLPADLPPGSYQLIVGMYNRDDAAARLLVDGGDYLELGTITIR